jgi:hypothetical protein
MNEPSSLTENPGILHARELRTPCPRRTSCSASSLFVGSTASCRSTPSVLQELRVAILHLDVERGIRRFLGRRAVDLGEGHDPSTTAPTLLRPSKAARDAGNAKAMADPRMQVPDPVPFRMARMVYGGFQPIVEV